MSCEHLRVYHLEMRSSQYGPHVVFPKLVFANACGVIQFLPTTIHLALILDFVGSESCLGTLYPRELILTDAFPPCFLLILDSFCLNLPAFVSTNPRFFYYA